jgi:hypothetical protein
LETEWNRRMMELEETRRAMLYLIEDVNESRGAGS